MTAYDDVPIDDVCEFCGELQIDCHCGEKRKRLWCMHVLGPDDVHAAEPVYQYQATPDSWVDCDYDLYNASGDPKRILYTHPQPAQDASNPLKGWIFDKVNMGRGDERYICTPNGANATTVRNESTSDHRERLLWLIADAMVKESGR